MKMGIIGYGGMAHGHKDVINTKINGLAIKGVWDTDPQARARAYNR